MVSKRVPLRSRRPAAGSALRRVWTCCASSLALALTLGAAPADDPERPRPVPNFGLMYNDDGDFAFTSSDPARAMANLRAQVNALAGTPVRTLMYCVGSDIMNYPTRVGSRWGWRETPYSAPGGEADGRKWAQRLRNAKAVMDAGYDPPREAALQAIELGLRFVPSYRMNDAHFRVDPLHHPFTSRFWLEHQPELTIGESPLPIDASFGRLLDFGQPRVRAHRLAIIGEVIDRYAGLMAGIELDFSRVPVLFARGEAEGGAPLVTEMVAEVRRRLDRLERETGRPYYLFVRVPPTLRDCRWAGLDVATWMRERLVDVVTPSPNMTLDHGMPIREFVDLAEPSGCRVYPGLLPRTSYRWPFASRHASGAYSAPAAQHVTADLVRGAAANYWAQGASGFQLFNFPHEDGGSIPFSDRVYRILRDLDRPETLELADAAYAVTPAVYIEGVDSFQYQKQIPAELSPRIPTELLLPVAHPSLQAEPPQEVQAILRLGLRGVEAGDGLRVLINDASIADGVMGESLVEVAGEAPTSQAPYREPARSYFQVDVPRDHFVAREAARITVALQRDGDAPARLVSCELLLRFGRRYEEMIHLP